jgi:hypothetical protein
MMPSQSGEGDACACAPGESATANISLQQVLLEEKVEGGQERGEEDTQVTDVEETCDQRQQETCERQQRDAVVTLETDGCDSCEVLASQDATQQRHMLAKQERHAGDVVAPTVVPSPTSHTDTGQVDSIGGVVGSIGGGGGGVGGGVGSIGGDASLPTVAVAASEAQALEKKGIHVGDDLGQEGSGRNDGLVRRPLEVGGSVRGRPIFTPTLSSKKEGRTKDGIERSRSGGRGHARGGGGRSKHLATCVNVSRVQARQQEEGMGGKEIEGAESESERAAETHTSHTSRASPPTKSTSVVSELSGYSCEIEWKYRYANL